MRQTATSIPSQNLHDTYRQFMAGLPQYRVFPIGNIIGCLKTAVCNVKEAGDTPPLLLTKHPYFTTHLTTQSASVKLCKKNARSVS